ncbi:DEAD/DEAH box helicase [Flavobacterium psychrophilum]|jgi:ATP-dependent RNA helicase RhlE|uniref:DEAD-box ATP-dependent RNA helicase RhpA n=2 Tax=Flavobacterium psychrophilum TaxID=96345 RepID=A6H095_FLAPJ|nr:DEAD/DEAH box helicase [Flavobacterium psychrophilum]AIJ37600.1 ATP-dependent RNA helicase srmB [Flavobacterium psychrophilum]AKC19744.1 RNA helicase [Flavobacterium psychrophilum]AKC22117.1 RNA helicase [Flavobacterium psychrophilum]AKC24485.1 RNA helicase [Flavobacterium psychrophilum]AKC26807.1 RNA helicase [Flavobacterium psychrophilum]
MLFEDLSLSKSIQRAVFEEGYLSATPIQEQSIPIILAGQDLIGCAQTGTGKTAAFAIPIIHNLHRIVGSSKKEKLIRTLVVTPTRELAVQIGESFDTYGKYTNLKQLTIFGGVSQNPQVEQLKSGIDILIATPGRLLDLHKQGFINLDHMHHLVLDEADQMLDMGFINDVKKIVKLTPKNRQTLLFSATMPIAIRELAEMFLTDPATVQVAPVSSTIETVDQRLYYVDKADKRQLLYHIIKEEKLSNILVFSRTKHGADNIAKALKKQGLNAEAIHGDKSQNARQRALDNFKNKACDILVATDIAARGIDIEFLPYVINFDLPNIPETYVHRIGRTGRAGREGMAISFCGKDEEGYWKDIIKLTKAKVTTIDEHPFPWKKGAQEATKVNSSNRSGEKEKSRKSDASKKNKKRWY